MHLIEVYKGTSVLTLWFVFTADIILITQFLQQFKEVREIHLSITVWFVTVRDLSDLNVTCNSL